MEGLIPTCVGGTVEMIGGGVDPRFHHASPLDGRDSLFCVFVGKPFKKTVWSRHLFLFYFKGENKIRKKNPICDS